MRSEAGPNTASLTADLAPICNMLTALLSLPLSLVSELFGRLVHRLGLQLTHGVNHVGVSRTQLHPLAFFKF